MPVVRESGPAPQFAIVQDGTVSPIALESDLRTMMKAHGLAGNTDEVISILKGHILTAADGTQFLDERASKEGPIG